VTELRDVLTSQTGITSADQLILFENHELHEVTDGGGLTLPCTSPSNPLYLFSTVDTTLASSPDSVLSATVRKLLVW